MTVFLRFIGIVNAAVWFGAVFFFTVCAAPALFSPEMKRLFGQGSYAQAYTGLVAQMALGSLFLLQYWCGAIALLHQLAEWVYLGKRVRRFTLGMLLVLYCLALLGGLGLYPKMQQWHRIKYSTELYRQTLYTSEQKAIAARHFQLWHGVSQAANVLILGGLAFYLLHLSQPANGPRFIPGKFRS